MKWLWRKHGPEPGPQPDTAQARRGLEAVVAQRPEVERLNHRLRTHRIENGFARKVFAIAPREGR